MPTGALSEETLGRFAPFANADCMLPGCTIQFHNSAECGDFLKESPAFSAYIENCAAGILTPGSKTVSSYCFSPCGNGVAVKLLNEEVWAWAHNGWTRIDVVSDSSLLYSNASQLVCMRAYQYVALYSGALLLHAAAVAHAGMGIVFCGVPGAGKSTQARLWEHELGAEAINNDQPCIVYRGGKAYVCGSPWSGKEPCYKDLSLPVRALVMVEKNGDNVAEPLRAAEAFALLYLNEYIVPVRDDTERLYTSAVEKLVASVPVLRYRCDMTADAPKRLFEYLVTK